MASGTHTNSVVMPSDPCFQFFQTNMRWVDPSPKSEMQLNTERVGSVPKNWVGSNPTHNLQPNTRLASGGEEQESTLLSKNPAGCDTAPKEQHRLVPPPDAVLDFVI
jgi:hypothetical protein